MTTNKNKPFDSIEDEMEVTVFNNLERWVRQANIDVEKSLYNKVCKAVESVNEHSRKSAANFVTHTGQVLSLEQSVENLVSKYSNDQELGAAIRSLINATSMYTSNSDTQLSREVSKSDCSWGYQGPKDWSY